ncbi:MAG: hypothetical protein O3A80_01900 [bacterium]|nr:hypothetical protein [bacterium]
MDIFDPNIGTEDGRLSAEELINIVEESDMDWPEPSSSDIIPMDEIAAVRLYFKRIGVDANQIDLLLAEIEEETSRDMERNPDDNDEEEGVRWVA